MSSCIVGVVIVILALVILTTLVVVGCKLFFEIRLINAGNSAELDFYIDKSAPLIDIQ